MDMNDDGKIANIVVIGAGWWSQGWHLPHLGRNSNVRIAAIVERSDQPRSSLNPDLESASAVASRYGCPLFQSTEELLSDRDLAPRIDGAIICASHASHAEIGSAFICEGIRRLREGATPRGVGRPLHLFMEKPMTTDVRSALDLRQLVSEYRAAGGRGSFLVNHTANYRAQAREARRVVVELGAIGDSIRHVDASFAAPLSWLFNDPINQGWNEPDPNVPSMIGNGFAWGQSCHLLAWVLHIVGDRLGRPASVYCSMTHSEETGADVSFAATVKCEGGATMSLSGTSLLPGNQYADPPVGKRVSVGVFGTEGALFYAGDDSDAGSGRLEIRRGGGIGPGMRATEVLCPDLGFQFEDCEMEGSGPESLQSFIAACSAREDYYVGADSQIGLQTVQIVDAMYRSHKSGAAEEICNV